MKEEFLHYIWKYKLYQDSELKSTSNENIEILNQGTHNYDSGPDFLMPKLR